MVHSEFSVGLFIIQNIANVVQWKFVPLSCQDYNVPNVRVNTYIFLKYNLINQRHEIEVSVIRFKSDSLLEKKIQIKTLKDILMHMLQGIDL